MQPLYSEWPYLIPGALKLGQRGTLLFYNYYQSSDDLTAKPICQNKDQVKYRLARCIPCPIRLLNNCMCTAWMVKVTLSICYKERLIRNNCSNFWTYNERVLRFWKLRSELEKSTKDSCFFNFLNNFWTNLRNKC